MTCRNRNETLKYPGRFLRDSERYFRKTGTIFEKNCFRQIRSIISLSIYNEISPSQSNITIQRYHSGNTSCLLIQRLWIRVSVILWMHTPLINSTLDFWYSKLHICKILMYKFAVEYLFVHGEIDLWVFVVPDRYHYHLSMWYDTVFLSKCFNCTYLYQ